MRRPVAIALFVLLVAGAAWLQTEQVVTVRRADGAYRRAQDPQADARDRLAAAALAVRLQPQVTSYQQAHASALAESYVRAGRLIAARRVLVAAWALDRSNETLRAQLREVNLKIQALDTWKAHIQHAREGPKGELDPEDVIP